VDETGAAIQAFLNMTELYLTLKDQDYGRLIDVVNLQNSHKSTICRVLTDSELLRNL
jgi:hypothetical protein